MVVMQLSGEAMIEHLQADALICFCLASLALSEDRFDEYERLTMRAVEHMSASAAKTEAGRLCELPPENRAVTEATI